MYRILLLKKSLYTINTVQKNLSYSTSFVSEISKCGAGGWRQGGRRKTGCVAGAWGGPRFRSDRGGAAAAAGRAGALSPGRAGAQGGSARAPERTRAPGSPRPICGFLLQPVRWRWGLGGLEGPSLAKACARPARRRMWQGAHRQALALRGEPACGWAGRGRVRRGPPPLSPRPARPPTPALRPAAGVGGGQAAFAKAIT